MKSAFIPFDDRLELINDTIKPGYAALITVETQLLSGALRLAGAAKS